MKICSLISMLCEAIDECRLVIRRTSVSKWLKTTNKRYMECVTNIDLEIEHIIVRNIVEQFPFATIVSEENYSGNRIDSNLCFVIDPIDGTHEFVSGKRGYSISIAVYLNSVPILGIMDFPAYNRRYIGIAGHGVVCNETPLPDLAINPGRLRVAVSPTQLDRYPILNIFSKNDLVDLVPIGALTPKIELILNGTVDAALYLPFENSCAMLWDYSAAAIILDAAGGIFTNMQSEGILSLLPTCHESGWVAGGINSHKRLIELIDSYST